MKKKKYKIIFNNLTIYMILNLKYNIKNQIQSNFTYYKLVYKNLYNNFMDLENIMIYIINK